MSFFGLASYGSDDEKPSYSNDSDSDDSDDSEGGHANHAGPSSVRGDGDAPAAAKLVLPTPDDAFGQVSGPPKFLMPEATKPIARNASHAPPPVSKRDVTYIDEPERRVAENAVIAAAPKRYKEDELRAREKAREEAAGGGGGGGNKAGGDALAMAMLGVKPKKVLGGKSTFGAPTSKPMDVAEFLAKGPGGALMPRKKGGNDRMEQEKKKRLAAQNGRDSREWKSEAEMVLRQQYDS